MDTGSTKEEKMTKEELALEYIKAASILLGGSFTVWDTYHGTTKKKGRKITLEYDENDEKHAYSKIPSRY